MKLVKFIAGLLLALSLTLPLSTCKGPAVEGNEAVQPVTERYLVSSKNTAKEWLLAFTFCLPLVFVLFFFTRQTSVKGELLSLSMVIPASFVIWWHSETGAIAAGGFMAIVSILVFVVSTAVSAGHMLNKNRLATRKDARQL